MLLFSVKAFLSYSILLGRLQKAKAKAEGAFLFAYFHKDLSSKLATPNHGER